MISLYNQKIKGNQKSFIIKTRDTLIDIYSLNDCVVYLWQESPIKAHVARFENDQALCVVEVRPLIFFEFFGNCFSFRCWCQAADGNDSKVQTLRKCLQSVEATGLVEYELGGHSADRPAGVFAGQADDRFLGFMFAEKLLLVIVFQIIICFAVFKV